MSDQLNRNSEGNSPLGWVMVVAAVSCVVGVTIPAIANLKINTGSTEVNMPDQDHVDPVIEGSKSYMQAFEWAARVKLEDLGLHHSLKVTSTSDGQVLINGTLSSRHFGRYQIFKSWFKSKPNFPEIVDEVERISDLSNAVPVLKSVWFKEPATAFFHDGSSGVVGQKVSDGWQILKISETEIIIQKHGNIISLDY